mmetsp:Transcript_95146/g.308080  ORF Transcript_95146/g.308080 Transcript_95146/m.308080 type:complete len:265 (+) Transcript_95146:85-879(+)
MDVLVASGRSAQRGVQCSAPDGGRPLLPPKTARTHLAVLPEDNSGLAGADPLAHEVEADHRHGPGIRGHQPGDEELPDLCGLRLGGLPSFLVLRPLLKTIRLGQFAEGGVRLTDSALLRSLAPSIALDARRLESCAGHDGAGRQEVLPHLKVEIDPLLDNTVARSAIRLRHHVLEPGLQLRGARPDGDEAVLPRPTHLHDTLLDAVLVDFGRRARVALFHLERAELADVLHAGQSIRGSAGQIRQHLVLGHKHAGGQPGQWVQR